VATQEELYKRYDAFVETARRRIRQEFNRITLAPFDKLNVIQAGELTESIWRRVDRANRRAYAELCEWVYEWVYVQYGAEAPRKDWTEIVDRWLKGYDPVTRYVYESELERKRLRLVEGILTARETQDRTMLEDVARSAASLLLTQSTQVGLDIMGAVQMEAYTEVLEAVRREEGEQPERVQEISELIRYNACDDSKTCGECRDDDGKVFRVSEAPRIPRHYRCRCWYTRA